EPTPEPIEEPAPEPIQKEPEPALPPPKPVSKPATKPAPKPLKKKPPAPKTKKPAPKPVKKDSAPKPPKKEAPPPKVDPQKSALQKKQTDLLRRAQESVAKIDLKGSKMVAGLAGSLDQVKVPQALGELKVDSLTFDEDSRLSVLER